MSDLIDRQALKAAHGLGTDCATCKRDTRSCQYDRDFSMMDFCEWIDDAPTASPWHRVEEPPKENGKYVAINTKAKWWYEARYENGNWKAVDLFGQRWVVIHPTHWMPLPEPPKEDA